MQPAYRNSSVCAPSSSELSIHWRTSIWPVPSSSVSDTLVALRVILRIHATMVTCVSVRVSTYLAQLGAINGEWSVRVRLHGIEHLAHCNGSQRVGPAPLA